MIREDHNNSEHSGPQPARRPARNDTTRPPGLEPESKRRSCGVQSVGLPLEFPICPGHAGPPVCGRRSRQANDRSRNPNDTIVTHTSFNQSSARVGGAPQHRTRDIRVIKWAIRTHLRATPLLGSGTEAQLLFECLQFPQEVIVGPGRVPHRLNLRLPQKIRAAGQKARDDASRRGDRGAYQRLEQRHALHLEEVGDDEANRARQRRHAVDHHGVAGGQVLLDLGVGGAEERGGVSGPFVRLA
jgi:hypothetical protein